MVRSENINIDLIECFFSIKCLHQALPCRLMTLARALWIMLVKLASKAPGFCCGKITRSAIPRTRHLLYQLVVTSGVYILPFYIGMPVRGTGAQ